MTRDIQVLVVDDCAVMRAMICDSIAEAPGMSVAATARDGREAVEIFTSTDAIDVVTLDVQMPNMDGLATLDAMLAHRPVPVLMVSALTRLGGETTLEALDRGAVDYVAKPQCGAEATGTFREELLRKIRGTAGTDVCRILQIRKDRRDRRALAAARSRQPKPEAEACPAELADKCIAIGVSTGGPPALATLFQSLRPPTPPIVVVQHMPAHFTKSLAARLDSLGELHVREAARGDVLRPNQVLIAPGGTHLRLRRDGNEVKTILRDGPQVSGHKPSVDVMMSCVAELFPGRCVGVIMTGMGRDGVEGCRLVRAAGGFVLGQDEATSDVYGMNKVAFLEGHVDQQFALAAAAATLRQQIRRLWAPLLAGSPGSGSPD